MNLNLNNLNLSAAPAKAPAAPAPAAAGDAQALQVPAAGTAVPAADGAPAAAAQPALAFAQWLGLEQLAPAAPDDMAAVDAAAPAPVADTAAEEQQPAPDAALLGAMAMPLPLMPVAQATLAAVAAALPGMPAANVKEAAPAADTDGGIAVTGDAARRDARGTLAAAFLPAAPAPAQAKDTPAAVLPADSLAANGDTPQQDSAATTERGAANTVGMAAPAPGNGTRTADTVTLSGPPAAWRQTLQEALGDRLQLQVGKNAEQAVIRLEPPMLGRVEIAIRHSAGSLEVHISATHGEVLRQLQAVGENLRNDLAQRQFTDVAVNIAQAPRAAGTGAGAQFAGDGQGGRGRQPDGGQEQQTPGNALAEADNGAAPFSLHGRA